MKGGGVLERMGSYLDALRSMDLTNTQDVVGAFEALPKGYGRHLEMKLLMRSWSAIDPEAALEYARMQLDEKVKGGLEFPKLSRVGQTKTPTRLVLGPRQITRRVSRRTTPTFLV